MQVEYCPSLVVGECWNLLKELLQSIVGSVAVTFQQSLKARKDELYAPAMTMQQYLEHFNNFRKAAAVSQPPSR